MSSSLAERTENNQGSNQRTLRASKCSDGQPIQPPSLLERYPCPRAGDVLPCGHMSTPPDPTTHQFDPLAWWRAQNRCLRRAQGELERLLRPVRAGTADELDLADKRWARAMTDLMDNLLDGILSNMAHPGLANHDQAEVRRVAMDTKKLADRGELFRDRVNQLAPQRREGRLPDMDPHTPRPDGFSLRDEANALVAKAFRNGPLERLHAGAHSPLLEDPSLSRLTNAEMKELMLYACRTLARQLEKKQRNPREYFREMVLYHEDYCRGWEREDELESLSHGPGH